MALRLVVVNNKPTSRRHIDVPVPKPKWGDLVWVNGLGGGPKDTRHLAILQTWKHGVASVYGLQDRAFYEVAQGRARYATLTNAEREGFALKLLKHGLVGQSCDDMKAVEPKLRTIMDVELHKGEWKVQLRNPRGGREYELSLSKIQLLKQ